jgi:ferric-dicitrate binding protein FerR (iron transport regulator)
MAGERGRMSAQPPSPERIASWEQQALALLTERTSEEKILAHLRYVGCPADTAREIIARNRGGAKTRRRYKGVGIALTGAGMIALVVAVAILRSLGIPIPLPVSSIWLFVLGFGMVLYGTLQMLFG